MVKTLLSSLLCFLLMLSGSLSANELTAEPDRTQLYEGEVLTLTVKGSMKIEINLSNLFSFDLSQLPSPDIEKVEPDFEIIARNQRYSVQTVNNEMVGEITWTYQLAPTRTGTLTIPELTFKDSTSAPVTIEVVSGTPPDQPAASRDSFIELSADKADMYVQEQLVLTVQLYFTGNLIRGELSDPEHPDAIIEGLGKQREFTTQRDGTRYRVVERRYAIFPQTPGELRLPAIRFEGQVRDATGQLRFLRDRQALYDVQVKPVPDSYPDGQPWLPATSLALAEDGLPSSAELAAGSNLNRKITLRASGLPSEALPPLPVTYPTAIRHYPEQPERNTEATPDGLVSTLQQVSALVPVNAGEITLPAVRIPWWNTRTDQLEEAVLPERQYRIEGGLLAAVPPVNEPSTPDTPLDDGQAPDATHPSEGNSPWLWSTLVLGVLWLATLVLWGLRKGSHKHHRDARQGEHGHDNERQAFEKLSGAIRKGSPETSGMLLHWARLKFPGQRFVSADEVVRFSNDQAMMDAFRAYQKSFYGAGGNHHASIDETTKGTLLDATARLRERHESTGQNGDLAPLYPAGLSG